MSFLWPSVLWCLLALPLLVGSYVLLLKRRKKFALKYSGLALVKQAQGKWAGVRRHVPPARVEEVAHHYELFDGVSPITTFTLKQAEGLQHRLAAAGSPLPVFVGMRNWHPFLSDTLAEMSRLGVRRAIGFIMAAQSSYSSCEQYRENVLDARVTTEGLHECSVATARGLTLVLPVALPLGERVCLSLRAHDVLLSADPPGRVSARNVLPARVERIETTDGDALVTLAAGEPIVAKLTSGAVARLGLREGSPVYALIKAQALRRIA